MADLMNDRATERRHARRAALVLGLVAVAVYASFILYAMRHGHA
jgi:hypothetical protein